jgi:hypothetical protein
MSFELPALISIERLDDDVARESSVWASRLISSLTAGLRSLLALSISGTGQLLPKYACVGA